MLSAPGADSKVRQGITTEVIGNCGFSPAPVAPQTLDLLKEYVGFLNPDLPWTWQRLGEYYERVSDQGCAMNLVPLVGHGAVRIAVMGFDDRAPGADELLQMQRLVSEAMEDGAFGLSSGLIYTPGCYGDTAELVALAQVARQAGGVYATHMRGEGGTLEEAISEALTIGEEAGIPVQISHLKASGRENWGKMERALQMIEAAQERGIAVTADIYPYVAGSTTMTSLFPAWTLEGGMDRFLARIGDRDTRQRIIDEVQGGGAGWSRATGSLGWDDILVASCQQQKQFEGCTVAQIADAMGKEPPEAMMDFLLTEQGRVSVVLFMMSEENVRSRHRPPVADDRLRLPGAGDGAGRQAAPADVWHVPARVGKVRARRTSSQPRGRCPQNDLDGGRHLRPQRPRRTRRGKGGGYHDLRCGHRCRPGHLRRAAPVFHRH